MTGAAILSGVWRIARISIPIPLALILAVGLWFQFDKASTVRKAVNAAVADLVAQEERAAAKAREDADRQIAAVLERRLRAALDLAEAEAAARLRFEQELALAADENRVLQERIDDVEANIPSGDGRVGQRLFDSLHNK